MSDMKKAAAAADQYPIRRGILGNVAFWFGMLMTRLLVKLHFRGQENIPHDIPYVIAANHQTYVDGMWIGAGLGRAHFKHFSCIAGSDLATKHGWLGRIILRVGRAIPIDRYGNPVRGLILAKKKVDEGNILLVHPEGTRTSDGRVAPLQSGAAYIAIKSKVPLLPVYIQGGYDVFPRSSKWPKPRDPQTGRKREIILSYGPVFDAQQYQSADELTAELAKWMHDAEAHALRERT